MLFTNNGPQQIYLSTLAPLLALALALYTLLTVTVLLILLPLRLCMPTFPSPNSFYRFLSPPPTFQLRLIFSSYEQDAINESRTRSITKLVLFNMVAPFYAGAIAAAAWVAAIFWSYTAILGNPDGKEERDDGREAVLSVRGWWERWLVRGLD